MRKKKERDIAIGVHLQFVVLSLREEKEKKKG